MTLLQEPPSHDTSNANDSPLVQLAQTAVMCFVYYGDVLLKT